MRTGQEVILAAGGVVWRQKRTEAEELYGYQAPVEVVVVHRPKYDDWTFPKGKLKPRESAPVGAVREIAEETGVQACLGPQLGSLRYEVEGETKAVTYWLATARQSPAVMARGYVEPASTQEVDEVRWVPLDEVEGLLTYEFDRELARRATARLSDGWGASVAFILLRHGKAKNRLKWREEDELRPLKTRGKRQAKELRGILSAFGVARVWSSPWKRCQQTLRPYVKATGIQVVNSDVLAEDGYLRFPDDTVELLRQLSTRTVETGATVLCTHSPVLRAWQRMLGPDFLNRTLAPLRTGEALVLHLQPRPDGNAKIVAVERHRAVDEK